MRVTLDSRLLSLLSCAGVEVLHHDERHAGIRRQAPRSCVNASRPPAEAPTPTIGNSELGSGSPRRSSAASFAAADW